MRNEKYAIWPVFMAESPKFLHLIGNRGRRTRWWRQILKESRNKTVLRMHNEKYAIWRLVMAESPKLLHSSAMDLWTRLWGRYHVPRNVFLVLYSFVPLRSFKVIDFFYKSKVHTCLISYYWVIVTYALYRAVHKIENHPIMVAVPRCRGYPKNFVVKRFKLKARTSWYFSVETAWTAVSWLRSFCHKTRTSQTDDRQHIISIVSMQLQGSTKHTKTELSFMFMLDRAVLLRVRCR